MKRIFYFLFPIATVVVIGCKGLLNDPPPSLEKSKQTHQSQITAEKAKAAFEGSQANLSQFTRAQADDDHSLMPGAFSVDWSGSVWSYDGRAESFESAISASRHFIACNGDQTVEVRQRLLSYMDEGDTAVRFYIATIIPTVEFYETNSLDFADQFIQCDRQGREFSGIVIYHTLSGLFCEIASFDKGQISVVYNAEQDYIIDDYDNMVASVNFVLGDFKLYVNSNPMTRAGFEGQDPYEADVVEVRICKWCHRRLLGDWQKCGCKTTGMYDPVTGTINWITYKDKPSMGGGGIILTNVKRPCYDLATGKANPLMEMELAPPGNDPVGATWGNTRYKGSKFHQGIDLAALVGTYVYAVRSGLITRAIGYQPDRVWNGNNWVYPSSYKGSDIQDAGNRITIAIPDGGGADSYWHLQAGNAFATNPRTGLPFAQEDWVNAGEHIGYTGRSGNGYGKPHHLHFGTQNASNEWINPIHVLNATPVVYADKRHFIATPCDQK